MYIDAMYYCIRIAEALTEGFTGRDHPDLSLIDGVMHDHVVGINSACARLVTDA